METCIAPAADPCVWHSSIHALHPSGLTVSVFSPAVTGRRRMPGRRIRHPAAAAFYRTLPGRAPRAFSPGCRRTMQNTGVSPALRVWILNGNMHLSRCKRKLAVTAPAFTIRSSDFIGLFGQREKHGRWQVATPACVPRGEYTPHPSRGGLITSSFHPATGIFFHIQGERI